MSEDDRRPNKPFLSGLKDPDSAKWKEAWERAERIEAEREAWIREKISREPKKDG